MYYLQSRYYSPAWGRFINADGYPSTGQGIAGNNMFAYCGNNPVMRTDEGGYCWNVIAGALVGAFVGGITKIACNLIEGKPVANGLGSAMAEGALGGALTAAFPASSTLISAGMSAVESISEDIKRGENILTIAVNATLSAGFAAVSDSGTIFSNKNIVTDSIKAVRKVLPGNHPKVKRAGVDFLKSTGKALGKEVKTGISDGLFVNYVNKGTQWLFGVFTGSKQVYGQ